MPAPARISSESPTHLRHNYAEKVPRSRGPTLELMISAPGILGIWYAVRAGQQGLRFRNDRGIALSQTTGDQSREFSSCKSDVFNDESSDFSASSRTLLKYEVENSPAVP